MELFGKNQGKVYEEQEQQERIAKARKLGLHFLKRAPAGARAQGATYPLALPETQAFLTQRRADTMLIPEIEELD